MLQGQIYAVIFKDAVVFTQIIVAEAFFSVLKREDILIFTTPRVRIANCTIYPQMILNAVSTFDGDIKAGFKFLIIRKLSYNSRKFDFLLFFQKWSTIASLYGFSRQPFAGKIKNGIAGRRKGRV